jgi:hypothetical protein
MPAGCLTRKLEAGRLAAEKILDGRTGARAVAQIDQDRDVTQLLETGDIALRFGGIVAPVS